MGLCDLTGSEPKISNFLGWDVGWLLFSINRPCQIFDYMYRIQDFEILALERQAEWYGWSLAEGWLLNMD